MDLKSKLTFQQVLKINVVTLFFLLITFPVGADIIVLKTQREVEGVITKVTKTGITVQTRNEILGVSFSQVKDIRPSTGARAENSPLLGQARLILPVAIPSGNTSKQKSKVYVYITDWCPWCRKLIVVLNQHRVQYTAYDIEKDKAADQDYTRYGGKGIPLTVVDGVVFPGYAPDAILRAIKTD